MQKDKSMAAEQVLCIWITPAEDLSALCTAETVSLACVEGVQWLAAHPQTHQFHFAHC